MKKISVWMFGLAGALWMGSSLLISFGISNSSILLLTQHGDIPTLFWGLLAFSVWSISLFEIADDLWWNLSALLFASALFFGYWFFSLSSFAL